MGIRNFPFQKPVWSPVSGNIFLHFTPAYEAAKVGYVRGSLEMCESTGALKVEFAYQTSDDGDTWSSAQAVTGGLNLTANGLDVDSAYRDMTTATAGVLFVRLGVIASGVSTSVTDLGHVSLKVDIKPH